jgi:hypothetical protein
MQKWSGIRSDGGELKFTIENWWLEIKDGLQATEE